MIRIETMLLYPVGDLVKVSLEVTQVCAVFDGFEK